MNEEILQSDSYFNIADEIDFDYPFNIVVGGRNIGKTFSAKLWWFERALEKNKPFISLVREVGEVESVANDYFDNQKEKGYLTEYEFYNYTLNNYARVVACKSGEEERKITI